MVTEPGLGPPRKATSIAPSTAALGLDTRILGNRDGIETGSQVLTSIQGEISTHRLQRGRDISGPLGQAKGADPT